MKTLYKTIRKLSTLATLAWLLTYPLQASGTFRSLYLGDGVFKYEITVDYDPSWLVENAGFGFAFSNLTEVIETNAPPAWEFSHTRTNEVSFMISLDPVLGIPTPRPYKVTATLRSSYTNYRAGEGYVIFEIIDQRWYNGQPIGGALMVGFQKFDILLPCQPAEADGSPPATSGALSTLQEIRIEEVLIQNNRPSGLRYNAGSENTLLAQASHNLVDWSPIQFIYGYPTSTVWLANSPLDTYGKYVRLQYYSFGHQAPLPSLSSEPVNFNKSADLLTPAPSFTAHASGPNTVHLKIQTSTGIPYTASVHVRPEIALFKAIPFIGSGEETILEIDTTNFPTTFWISVAPQ